MIRACHGHKETYYVYIRKFAPKSEEVANEAAAQEQEMVTCPLGTTIASLRVQPGGSDAPLGILCKDE
jgi:hypothetical protein